MDASDVLVALISLVAALIGAAIGAGATFLAEKGTRDADRRKRCSDRLIEGTYRLDAAYSRYSLMRDQATQLDLQSAIRSHTSAVALIENSIMREHWRSYAGMLKVHFLYQGEEIDPLDGGIEIPSISQLNTRLIELTDELRHYESK